jgi:hypothetical protein
MGDVPPTTGKKLWLKLWLVLTQDRQKPKADSHDWQET